MSQYACEVFCPHDNADVLMTPAKNTKHGLVTRCTCVTCGSKFHLTVALKPAKAKKKRAA